LARSGQTNEAKLALLLAQVKDLYLTAQQAGGHPGNLVPMLAQLQLVAPSNLFNQYFGDVDLELGTAFYIDCGATNEYTDVLGRQWMPDAPYLVTSNAFRSTHPTAPIITNALLGDRYLPDAMLNSERWYTGDIRYQVGVPNGWYTVLLYFSENYPSEIVALQGIAILGRPSPAAKFATRPRIARTTRDGGLFGLLVDPQASLARYLAGEIPLRLQSSLDLSQWTTLPALPQVAAEGAFFWLPVPTNAASFYLPPTSASSRCSATLGRANAASPRLRPRCDPRGPPNAPARAGAGARAGIEKRR
jgi:hypothetical protein